MVWIPKISKRKIKEVGDVVLTSVMMKTVLEQ